MDDHSTMQPGPNFSGQPWAPVLIPLAVVVGVGVLVLCLALVRRKHQHDHALHLDQQGRQALERDLEDRITRGYRVPGGGAVGDSWANLTTNAPGRRVRTANRWAWANNLALGRREEGLNELGEAPPPYEQSSGSAVHKDDAAAAVTEMADLPPSGGRGGATGSTRPAAVGTTTTPQLPPPLPVYRGRGEGAEGLRPPDGAIHLYG